MAKFCHSPLFRSQKGLKNCVLSTFKKRDFKIIYSWHFTAMKIKPLLLSVFLDNNTKIKFNVYKSFL